VNGNVLYAGTIDGLYISSNDGTSWTQISTGLTNTSVYSLATDGTILFAGTADGMFHRPISQINSVNDIPADAMVQLSASPNPFTSATTIQYSVPATENVSIKIYNIIGECVKTVVDNSQAKGSYQLTMDNVGMSSGVYYCSLQAGDLRRTIKIVLQ